MLLSRPSCGETSRSDEHLQRALHERQRLRDIAARAAGAGLRLAAAALPAAAAADQVLVGDELVAVLLHHEAGELPAADDEDLLVVLLQLLDQRDEVAVAADDHERVDVVVGERHLERVERQVDVGAVLVAARRQVALHHPDGVLREQRGCGRRRASSRVGDLGDDLAALLDGLEDGADVEWLVHGGLHADLDVVEIDEDGDL